MAKAATGMSLSELIDGRLGAYMHAFTLLCEGTRSWCESTPTVTRTKAATTTANNKTKKAGTFLPFLFLISFSAFYVVCADNRISAYMRTTTLFSPFFFLLFLIAIRIFCFHFFSPNMHAYTKDLRPFLYHRRRWQTKARTQRIPSLLQSPDEEVQRGEPR